MADSTTPENQEQNGSTSSPRPAGLEAFKAHVIAHKIDVALWAIRIVTLLCTIGYVLPIFNNASSAYYKALAGNAAVSALRLHQRLPPVSFTREYLERLLLEDSAHYLFYSLIFMNAQPQLLILIPVVLFAMLHSASYSLTLLDTLGQNSMWAARLLISLVEFQSRNILRIAALAEIMLFPIIVLMALFGRSGMLTPFVYYYFITWRYASRRNPYTRNTFHELRTTLDSIAAKPSLPSFVGSSIRTLIDFTCRMAPPLQQAS